MYIASFDWLQSISRADLFFLPYQIDESSMAVCLWMSKGIPKHDGRQDLCRDIVRIDALGDEPTDCAAQIRHKMPRECGGGASASVFGIGVNGGECWPLMQIVLAPYIIGRLSTWYGGIGT